MKVIRNITAAALAVGLVSLLGMGCEIISSVDHGLLETSSTAGSGGAGGSGPECVDAAVDCPATGSECIVATCEGGVCGTMQLAEGTPAATQTPADCNVAQCDAAGEVVNVADDTDIADDMNECTDNLCDMGNTSHPNVADGTSCSGGRICVAGVCSDRTCTDTFKDGTETDVDCGGGCAPCGDNLGCGAAVDCQSGVCTGGTCTPATCSDAVKNQDESDTDCGGICGSTCGDNAVCNSGTDCVSGVCNANACQPAGCTDSTLNGDETDVDCGGSCSPCANGDICAIAGDCQSNFCSGAMCAACAGDNDCAAAEYCNGAAVCVPDDADGAVCNAAGHCTSNNCVDGFCCDTACGSTCMACSAAKTGGVNGTCANVTNGTDLDNECAAATCKTGTCNGNGACGDSPLNTTCGSSPACAAGVQTNQDLCNGTGSCTDNGTTSCGVYVCGATACKSSCANDNDCVSTHYCFNNACTPKLNSGASCVANNECSTGNCVDGVCCGSASCSTCQSCNLNGLGTCSNVASGQDDPGTCSGTSSCDGSGACKLDQGQACTLGSQCLNGNCVDGFCCNNACGSTCMACSNAKTGAANGTCANVTNGTDLDNECANGVPCQTGTCNGAGACGVAANGASCGSALSCSGTTQTNQDTCNAVGTCIDNLTTSCGNFACGATSCNTTCTSVAQCNAAIADCDVANSVCKLLAGQPCTVGNATQCLNGVCPAGAVCP